jgi:hypothetical protein
MPPVEIGPSTGLRLAYDCCICVEGYIQEAAECNLGG